MSIALPSLLSPAFSAGLALSLSLIMAIGPQNAHVVRMGLRRQHLWLTVATSMLADFVLIALGVLGLAELGGLSDKLQGALVGAGVLFLLVYGWQAGQRCWRPTAGQPLAAGAHADQPMTRRQAVLTALGFSWLNPHAWLDTAVLIGTASLAWGQPGNQLFGAGALTGSLLWFTLLGAATFWLGRRLGSPLLWRAIDGLVALTMWGTAAWLVSGLA
ncbi:MAG: lysine transporter LysE [Burkholderiales bacterium RIFOXYC12_FULL_65_23]|uniref:LysE/ArgO family amino acid transporter n=1 Tax=Malikia spinosa TaxID=86180 RepID=UPI0008CC94FA|nr:LysE family transporter [Malikia spinosa]OGB70808.1 MAG: lysine transporter LysE [Burkholderiales bacterium RIFOXYC12_FULL_65_23]